MKAKTTFLTLLPLILTCLFIISIGHGAAESRQGNDQEVRHSILSGTWYPNDFASLRSTISEFINRASAKHYSGTLRAIVVPHAGYRYSGEVAAHAYKLLEGLSFKRVILIGPSHRIRFKGVSVNTQAAYRTPLGTVPVDREFGKRLIAASDSINMHKRAHLREHSLEIQVPFLQTVLTSFEIVPVLMGQQDLDTCRELAKVLSKCLEERKGTLLLASTDLSHYHSANMARELDGYFMEQLKAFTPEGLFRSLGAGKCEACGGGPVISTLLAAKSLGADKVEILNYAHSGEVTGDNRRVVGYMAAALFNSSGRDPHP